MELFALIAALAALTAGMVALERRHHRKLHTVGQVAEVVMIGGPMDGERVLAKIGGEYMNYQPMRKGWLEHRYEIRPGGWGVFSGSKLIEYPPAVGSIAVDRAIAAIRQATEGEGNE